MPSQRPRVSVRFDAKAQLERITRAAKLRKWTINTFMIDAADREAARLLTVQNDEQPIDSASNLSNASS